MAENKCKACNEYYIYLLKHLASRNSKLKQCSLYFSKQELDNMKLKAKVLKANSTSIKRKTFYSKFDRHNRYLLEKQKNANLVSNVGKKNTSNDEVALKCKIDKGFKRMEILVNKEIERNNSSLLPPLQQKVNSEKQ